MCIKKYLLILLFVLIVRSSYSQTILGKIPIPDGDVPTCAFYVPETQKFYTANLWHTNMSVIDVANHKIDATIPMPGAWMACTFVGVDKDNNRIYLGDVVGKIAVLSSDDYSLIKTLDGIVGVGFARDSVQDRNYIATSSNLIYILNGNTSAIVDSIETGESDLSFTNVNNLCFDIENNLLYVACNKERKIDIIDCGPDTLLKSITVDTLPSTLDINLTTDRVYTCCDSSVVVIDGVTLNVLTTIPLEGHPTDLTIDETNNKVYVAMEDNNGLVIDGTSNTVTDTIPFSSTFIRCEPSNNEIYMTVANKSVMKIVSILDYSLLETIILNYRLDDLVLDDLRNLLFVATTTGENNNILFKIDCNTDSIIDTLHVSDEAPYSLYLTYDKNLQRLYLAERNPKKLYCIDAETMTPISTHNLPDNPMHLNANPLTNKVYIPMLNSSQLLVFDGEGDSIETLVNIHAAPIDAEVNLNTNKIFVSTESWYLDIIDGTTNQVDTSIYLTSGQLLESNCVNDSTNEIYVCSFSGKDVTILDGNQNYAIINIIPFDHVMRDGIANESTNRIFVHDANSHIYIINGETHTTEDTITIAGKETRLAVNTQTGIIYALDYGGVLIIKDDAMGIKENKTINKYEIVNLFLAPNPFSNKIEITYRIPKSIYKKFETRHLISDISLISLKVYDLTGQLIRTLSIPELLPLNAQLSVVWDGKDDVGSNVLEGVYFIRLSIKGYGDVIRKAVLIR